jgi:very-short-patch-repair endonuclease
VGHGAVRRRVESGRLHRVHQGVYAVGHPALPPTGRWIAAVLACDGVLSHRSAAELWGLLPAANRHIQVSVPGIAGKKARRNVHIHRSRTLTPDLMTSHRGIPVTTPERTIADLRRAAVTRGCPATVSSGDLRRAIRQAGVLGLQIEGDGEPDRTRSELEYRFLRLCRRHRLPVPEVNVPVDSFLVDFLWRDRRLIVETDGYRYHGDRAAFEEDRNRDLKLKSLGYEVIRLSYRQVEQEPQRVAAVLIGVLSHT